MVSLFQNESQVFLKVTIAYNDNNKILHRLLHRLWFCLLFMLHGLPHFGSHDTSFYFRIFAGWLSQDCYAEDCRQSYLDIKRVNGLNIPRVPSSGVLFRSNRIHVFCKWIYGRSLRCHVELLLRNLWLDFQKWRSCWWLFSRPNAERRSRMPGWM
jgi:hypothetical protein